VSTQIAVRLPDSLVEYIDSLVADGEPSRAAVVTKALMRYQRQKLVERDAEIYRQTGGAYPEFDEWVGKRRDFPDLDTD
jgi:Arc/MetJ-type ribon-helix-helix transcriptional regulator